MDPIREPFEWAWQHPELINFGKKPSNETNVTYCIKVLDCLLFHGPWKRLPLSICFIKKNYFQQYSAYFSLKPRHMEIIKEYESFCDSEFQQSSDFEHATCTICKNVIRCDGVMCPMFFCLKKFHITCLAKEATKKSNQIIPIYVCCPSCDILVAWGDLVFSKKTDI